MRIRLLIISVFCSLCLSINAQQWNTVGDAEFENSIIIKDLMVLGDSLYIKGPFTAVNGLETNGMCIWDGSQFSSYQSVAEGETISYFQDELYIGGNNFYWDLGLGHIAIIAYDGAEWYSPGGGAFRY